MSKSMVQISNVAQLATPNANTTDLFATIADTAQTLEAAIGATFHSQTTEVRISVRGAGDLCVRFDGQDPVGGSEGEVWYPGAIMTFNVQTARRIKVVRDGATDCAIGVAQFTGGKLR